MSVLHNAVVRARDQFRFYAAQHRAKIQPAMDTAAEASTREKAIVNEELVAEMQAALDSSPAPSIAELDRIQDYRFGSMVKGERFAFARGLTINPTHLPEALDAMYADGWELLAIFGATDAVSIGFIFKRQPGVFSHRDFVSLHNENERLQRRVDELLGANNTEVEARRVAQRRLREFQEGTPLGDIK